MNKKIINKTKSTKQKIVTIIINPKQKAQNKKRNYLHIFLPTNEAIPGTI